MVIPEIEMPGHEVAAIHAYPQLTVGNKKVDVRTTSGVSNNLLNPASEFTYQFLFDVFDELATVSLHPMCILEEMRLEIRHSMIGPLTLLASPLKKNSASPRATAPKTGSCRSTCLIA